MYCITLHHQCFILGYFRQQSSPVDVFRSFQDRSPSEVADFAAMQLHGLTPADSATQSATDEKAVRRRVAAIEKAIHFMDGRQDAHHATVFDYSRHWAQAAHAAQCCSSQAAKQNIQAEWEVYRTDVLSQIFRQSCFGGCWAAWSLPRKLF
jgi:beta-galactosidase GanA